MPLQTLRIVVLAFFLSAVFIALPGHARAETKIAVVDLQRILTESKAGKGLQQQLDAAQRSFQDDMKKQDQALQATQAQMNKEEGKSSADLIQKKADFEKKVVEARQAVQKKKETLEKGANAAVNDLRTQAGQIIADIAQKDNYSLVLNRGTVIIADKSMDITDAVLKQRDAKVTKIDLKLDAAK